MQFQNDIESRRGVMRLKEVKRLELPIIWSIVLESNNKKDTKYVMELSYLVSDRGTSRL